MKKKSKKQKILPDLFIPNDLLTEKELQEIADRVLNGNELLGNIVYDYNCHIYTINRYITINDELRERFIKFVNYIHFNIANKEKSELSEEDIQKIQVMREILEVNEKAKDADRTIELLNKMNSREVAKELGMSKTKMYDTLSIMGFQYNKALKQWIHVDAKDIPKNLEELNRDLELIDLYVSRYGDFNLYNSDYIIKMIDAEIVEDVRVLAEELNYETEEDLINVLILRGLQAIDYRKVEVVKEEDQIEFTEKEHMNFLIKGAHNYLEECKQELIIKHGVSKNKLSKMTDKQIFMLYRSKTNN